MTRIVKLPTLVGCVLLSAVAANAQGAKDAPRKIMVSTTGTVFAKPDAAQLTFYVATQAAAKAREEHAKEVQKMKDALAKLGLANVEIQATPQALGNVTVGDRLPKLFGKGVPAAPPVPAPRLQHAQTQFVVSVREKNLDKLRDAIIKLADQAVENGASPTGEVEDPLAARSSLRFDRAAASGLKIDWLRESNAEQRRQAIQQAVAEARENAQAAVGDAKLTLTEIIVSVRQERPITSRLHPEQAGGGDVPIVVEVTVTFSF